MKSIITVLGLVMTFSASAQKFEIGLSGGCSNSSITQESLYTGDKGKWSYASALQFHYNAHEHFQIGAEVGMTRWERYGDWSLYAANNQYLGNKEVRFVLAERAVNIALRANYVLPFYQPYEDYVRSALYGGISAGVMVTGNNGNIEYSRYNPNTPTEYSYVSKYNFESGYGTMLGLQVGYAYYFSKLFGANVEFAPKMAWIKTIDPRYQYANDTYNIIYFPITVGVRVRFGEVFH